MRQLTKILFVALLIALPMITTACNTVEGAGKDTKAAGQAVQDSADRNK